MARLIEHASRLASDSERLTTHTQALDDLMRMTKVAVGVTKQPFTFYLAACLMYWVLCVASELVLARMEKRANRGVRRA